MDTTNSVAFDLDTVNELHRFEEAKRVIREAEAVKAEAEARIREALGTATVGTIAGVTVIKVSDRTRATVSANDLKAVNEELYNALVKVTEYSVLVTA